MTKLNKSIGNMDKNLKKVRNDTIDWVKYLGQEQQADVDILFFVDTRKAASNPKDTRKDASNSTDTKHSHPDKEAQKEQTAK